MIELHYYITFILRRVPLHNIHNGVFLTSLETGLPYQHSTLSDAWAPDKRPNPNLIHALASIGYLGYNTNWRQCSVQCVVCFYLMLLYIHVHVVEGNC